MPTEQPTGTADVEIREGSPAFGRAARPTFDVLRLPLRSCRVRKAVPALRGSAAASRLQGGDMFSSASGRRVPEGPFLWRCSRPSRGGCSGDPGHTLGGPRPHAVTRRPSGCAGASRGSSGRSEPLPPGALSGADLISLFVWAEMYQPLEFNTFGLFQEP